MPACDWESEDEVAISAVAPPPSTVTALWSCAAAVLITATRLSLDDALESRIVTGQQHVFGDNRVRYTRGTYGLMPDEWGTIDEAQLTDTASEFEKRDGHAKLFGAGVEGTVYSLSLAIRMPADRPMPEKGLQFFYNVRGQSLRFTVWAGGVERWRKSGLRMVDVRARHYTDFPDAIPVDIDDIDVPQDLAASGFTL